jgi:chaperone modulatory protein CbpM
METREFLRQAGLDVKVLEAWIAAGWLLPRGGDDGREFSDIDLARARLIHDLRKEFGVNDDGISVLLNLLDQLRGLRRTLTAILTATGARSNFRHGRYVGVDHPRNVLRNLKRARRMDEEDVH